MCVCVTICVSCLLKKNCGVLSHVLQAMDDFEIRKLVKYFFALKPINMIST